MVVFSKCLSATDAKRRCTVPMNDFRKKGFPKSAGQQKVNLKVQDESGRVWVFCCYTRREMNPKHPNKKQHLKPVLTGDWIPFVKSKNLREGDKVTIYEKQDEKGSMHYIKVEKQTSPKTRRSRTMKNSNKGSSSSHSNDNQSTASFQPSGDILSSVPNHDLGKITTTTSSIIHGEKIPASHSTSQNKACHKSETPSLSLSLEPTVTTGTIAATSSSTKKEQKLNPRSTSQGIPLYNTLPSLSLSPTVTTGTIASTSSSTKKEQKVNPRSTSQGMAFYNTLPSQSLSLKPTVTTGTIAATSFSTKKEQKLNPHSTSQGMAFYNTLPSLNLSLELTLKTTITESQKPAYTQDTIPKTINFLASFS